MARGMEHSDDDQCLGIHSKVDRMRKPAHESATYAALSRLERERISQYPGDGGVDGGSVLFAEARAVALVPLESVRHVTAGFFS